MRAEHEAAALWSVPKRRYAKKIRLGYPLAQEPFWVREDRRRTWAIGMLTG